MTNNKTCKNCVYCNEERLSSNTNRYYVNGRYYSEIYCFFCHRMPQKIEVDIEHWCGEFKQKDSEEQNNAV